METQMKSLFDVALAHDMKQRLGKLRMESEPQWGKMSVGQTLAHCALSLEMALGVIRPPRALMGRLVGTAIKGKVIGNDEPIRRNSPTMRELVVNDECNLDAERLRVCSLIDRFVAGGASVCTTHPHPFFGSLMPDEWGVLMYKHLDHHLRQFGA